MAGLKAGFTFTTCVALVLHEPELTVRLTVLLPEPLQLTECGPALPAPAGLAPVPKFHAKLAPGPAVPLNEMLAAWFSQTFAG